MQVFNGLAILASFASNDDPYQGPRDITTPERMVRCQNEILCCGFNLCFDEMDLIRFILDFVLT